jgi:hypothetical protein
MRRMMEDEKMFDNLTRVIESFHRVFPALNWSFEWMGFYSLSTRFERYFPQEELEQYLAWTVPDHIRDKLMRTFHAAKYCPGQLVRCSK